MTLSWGTAELAADLVRESGRSGPAAVLGCGAVGLATARVLQDRGFDVTIYARELPPDTTSNVAGAMWNPSFPLRSRAPHAGVGRAVRAGAEDLPSHVRGARGRGLRRPLAGALLAVGRFGEHRAAGLGTSRALPGSPRADGVRRIRLRRATSSPRERCSSSRRPTCARSFATSTSREDESSCATWRPRRSRGAAAANRRELHGPRRPGALRRSRADADQGPAHRAAAAAEGGLRRRDEGSLHVPAGRRDPPRRARTRGESRRSSPNLEAEKRILAGQRAIFTGMRSS